MAGKVSSENQTEKRNIKSPAASVHYFTLVLFGAFFNLSLMLVAFLSLRPSASNLEGVSWFFTIIMLFVPSLGSFFYCLFASMRSAKRITISPSYVVIFTVLPALLLGAYVMHSINSQVVDEVRMNVVINFLMISTIVYLSMIYLTSIVEHPIIRSLIGAYAEQENIQSGTSFYRTSMPLGHIINKIEEKKWVSELCGLRLVEKKEEATKIQLKLNKHETDFYIAFYAEKTDSGILASLTPYEMKESLAQKTITVSEDSQNLLQFQLDQIKESFKLDPITLEEAAILNESVNYAMSPARFPMLLRYRNYFLVIAVTASLSIIAVIAYSARAIEIQILVGLIAIIVALGSTAINLLGRK